jgi:hypothetical protein
MFAIIAVSVSAVLAPMMRAYSSANEFAEYNTLLDSAANRIINDLAQSTAAPLHVNESDIIVIRTHGSGNVIYTIGNDGVLLRNGNPVLSSGYYRNKHISFIVASAATSTRPAYNLIVTVGSDGGATVSRTYAVRPLALNQH